MDAGDFMELFHFKAISPLQIIALTTVNPCQM